MRHSKSEANNWLCLPHHQPASRMTRKGNTLEAEMQKSTEAERGMLRMTQGTEIAGIETVGEKGELLGHRSATAIVSGT